jgi:hypothetical protein
VRFTAPPLGVISYSIIHALIHAIEAQTGHPHTAMRYGERVPTFAYHPLVVDDL